MASLTKTWTGANSWSGGKVVVSSVPNTAGNYSDVTATLYGCRLDGGKSYNANVSSFYISINGEKKTFKSGITISGTSYTQIMTATVRVYHNDDGNKSITISCGGSITGTSYNLSSVTYSLALDAIARKSTLVAEAVELGTEMKLLISRHDDSFTDSVQWKCGNATGHICEKTSETELAFTPDVVLSLTNTTGTSVSITFTIETFHGDTSIGTNKTTVVCAIPETVVPSLSVEITDAMGYLDSYGKYIQGKSKINVTVTAGGIYGSSVTSYSTTVDGKTYTEAAFTTDEIVNSGELELTITVVDSRGRESELTESLSVYEYSVPKILTAKAKRCTSVGISSSTGAYLGLMFDAEATSLDSQNTVTYAVEYKLTTDSTYNGSTINSYKNKYSVTDGVYIFAAGEASYHIVLKVTDAFESVEKKIVGPSVTTFFSRLWRGLGAAFGKIAELEGVFDIGWKTRMFGGLLLVTPEDGTDFDTLLIPNVYRTFAEHTYANAPEEGVDAIFKIMGDENGLRQTFSVISQTNPRTYERSCVDGAWGAWMREVDTIFEYGTWTPTDGNNMTILGCANCTYYKIGKMVYIQGCIYGKATAADGGQNVITGLPYVASGGRQHIEVTYSNVVMADSSWNKMDLETRDGKAAMQFVYWANGRSWEGDCCLSDASNGYINFSGWYMTA